MKAIKLVIMCIMLAGCSARVNLDPASLAAPFIGQCTVTVTADQDTLCGVPVDSCTMRLGQVCADASYVYDCAYGATLTAYADDGYAVMRAGGCTESSSAVVSVH